MMHRKILALAFLGFCSGAVAHGQGSDSCVGAQPIFGVGLFPFDNTAATTDGASHLLCAGAGSDQIENDVWFEWMAPSSGVYSASTCGLTTIDSRMSIEDSPCGGMVLDCNDDTCGLQSKVTWTAASGQLYLIRIGSFPGSMPGSGFFTIFEGLATGLPVYRVSIDSHGPTNGLPDSATATAITAGDILGAAVGDPALGAQPTPSIIVSGGASGLRLSTHANCAANPSLNCPIELDALSYGVDGALAQIPIICGRLNFSVDEFAVGQPDAYVPTVRSEGAVGAKEAGADTFIPRDLPAPPVGTTPGRNLGAVDGDGLTSTSGSSYPGIGLVEPNPPAAPPDAGDNIDALTRAGTDRFPVYFSLDSDYQDPATLAFLTGSAVANGFLPGDVIVTPTAGGFPVVYASRLDLGLGETDDLDALALAESGDGVYSPSLALFDWLGGAVDDPDMLLFSIRRGSPILGTLDSLLNIPIVEGDILTAPIGGSLGGTVPPAIFIAAESLGLVTNRGGATGNDDLDALSIFGGNLVGADCNKNGCNDAVDISTGFSTDDNDNGVPDECEKNLGIAYCDSTVNSTGYAAKIFASGSTSVANNDLVLIGQPVPNGFGIFFYGANQNFIPFGNGFLCVQGPIARRTVQLASGHVLTHAFDNTNTLPAFPITPGSTWNFQGWFRDVAGGGAGFNTTSGLEIQFTP